MLRAIVLVLVLSSSPALAADAGDTPPASGSAEAGPGASKPEQPGASEPKPAKPGEAAAPRKPDLSPSLDFELLPPTKKPDTEASARIEREVARRRTMLTLHQGMGIATWTALAATTIVGQLDFNDRFRGGGDTGKYHAWHTGLAYGTTALFATAGLLAVLAPVPYPKKIQLDTATLHKASMALATVGMVAQIALGVWARHEAGSLRERDIATAHQIVGYTTFGAMTVGAVVLFFP
ncbi:hypothetical protein [Anaeromyxobacter oryzae]|uniref:Cytochrome b561 domain-containing protein n=1 Tax=Anaeromyxobacter oryzae TaxID=2918170 RepID=A0ABM7WU76_9BACT|nr:hypothetical protein [Anaeromyxobacter oryzae]BDG03054.1 hypothetical protein AMOR_20500 [Anaeromyxobacter oryzae]